MQIEEEITFYDNDQVQAICLHLHRFNRQLMEEQNSLALTLHAVADLPDEAREILNAFAVRMNEAISASNAEVLQVKQRKHTSH